MKYGILFISLVLFAFLSANAESLRGEHNSWAEDALTVDSDFGNIFSITFQASGADNTSEFKFAYSGWTTSWGTGTGYYNAGVNSYEGQCRSSASGDACANLSFNRTASKYYTFRLNGLNTWWDRKYTIMMTDNSPVTISSVSDNSASAGEGDVTVSITLSSSKSTQENVYIRYSTNGWGVSSFVLASGSGTSYSATIPGVNGATTVSYYVLTTTLPLAKLQAYTDLATLHGDNNSGSNYSYSPPCEGITEGKVVIDDGGLVYWADSDFNNGDLGDFGPQSTLKIHSAQVFIYKYACGDIASAKAYYRIYKQGSSPGSFSDIVTPYQSAWTIGPTTHQLWWNDETDISNINALTSCSSEGTYVIEFYFQASSSTKATYYRNNGGSNYKATFNYYTSSTWSGNISADWNTAGNWNNGVPSQYLDAVIPNGCSRYPVVSTASNATCKNLTVQSSASLTVNNRASFINHGTVSNSGSINYKLTIPSEEWHLIAMPGTHASSMFYFSGNPWIYLQSYVTSDDSWTPITPTTTSLTAGEGYSAWVEQDGEDGGTFLEKTISYTNPTIFGNYTKSLTYSGNGYNLICNPFPSDLNGNINSWTKTNTANSIHIWDGSAGNYLTYNGSTGTLPAGRIPALQGFFVKATGSNPSVIIPTASRMHTYSNLHKDEEWLINNLEIAVHSNDYYDATYIWLNEQAPLEVDNEFDVEKMYGELDAPQIYTMQDAELLSINGLPFTEGMIVQVGFEAPLNETYTLEFTGIEYFDGIHAILEDSKTENFIDLLYANTYEFVYEDGDLNRFKLHFYATTNNEIEEISSVNMYSFDNRLYISGENIQKISVYDVSGKLLIQKICNSPQMVLQPDLKTGIYIVSVQTNQGVINKSVYLTR